MGLNRRLLVVLFVATVATAADAARQRPVFSARSDLVVLHVMVTDRRGQPVTGLTRDSFVVLEDGERQPIEVFDARDAPVTAGLVVDSSGSMSDARGRVVAAVDTFARSSNRDDELFALTFNRDVHAALPSSAPFTSDPDTLRSAVSDALVTYGPTALYDAVRVGLDYASHGRYPVRLLVVISDGGDNASRATLDDVLRAIRASNTVVYTVAVDDARGRDASVSRLGEIAELSGGDTFAPRSVRRVEKVLGRIARTVRDMYTIGYAPRDSARDGRFRRIDVRVTASSGRAVRVRTRRGYTR